MGSSKRKLRVVLHSFKIVSQYERYTKNFIIYYYLLSKHESYAHSHTSLSGKNINSSSGAEFVALLLLWKNDPKYNTFQEEGCQTLVDVQNRLKKKFLLAENY